MASVAGPCEHAPPHASGGPVGRCPHGRLRAELGAGLQSYRGVAGGSQSGDKERQAGPGLRERVLGLDPRCVVRGARRTWGRAPLSSSRPVVPGWAHRGFSQPRGSVARASGPGQGFRHKAQVALATRPACHMAGCAQPVPLRGQAQGYSWRPRPAGRVPAPLTEPQERGQRRESPHKPRCCGRGLWSREARGRGENTATSGPDGRFSCHGRNHGPLGPRCLPLPCGRRAPGRRRACSARELRRAFRDTSGAWRTGPSCRARVLLGRRKAGPGDTHHHASAAGPSAGTHVVLGEAALACPWSLFVMFEGGFLCPSGGLEDSRAL